MTPSDVSIMVNERGNVVVKVPPEYQALAALLASDLRREGPYFYTVLARLYIQGDEKPWETVGNVCTLVIQGDYATIVNNFTDDKAVVGKGELRSLLERMRDELAFARARRAGDSRKIDG